jgi:serine/threonine protein kinase
MKKIPTASTTSMLAIPPSLCHRATAQLTSALGYLHRLDIAHGDIKPANVLLLRPVDAKAVDPGKFHLKLCDFGFSCVCGDKKLKSYCGTPAYLAPEVISPADAHRGYLGSKSPPSTRGPSSCARLPTHPRCARPPTHHTPPKPQRWIPREGWDD